jgi:raffinose/stachyose/melibiose transport system substrate-binding protein
MGMRIGRTVCVIVALLTCCAFVVSAVGKQEVKKQQVQIFTHYQEATKQKGVDVLMAGAETKYPQYDFVAEHMAYSQFLQVIKTRMASGDAPDVFQGRPYEYPEFIKAGEIVELTNQPFVSRIEEDALIENKIDGKLWALPTDVEARGIFYNKKMQDSRLRPHGVNGLPPARSSRR